MNAEITYNQKLQKVQSALPMGINRFAEHHDGFSFTVATELDAYKAAYIFRFAKFIKVKLAPNVNEWLISVYTQ